MTIFLQRVVTGLLALVLIAGALVVASIVIVVTAGIALAVVGWLWWRNRHLMQRGGRREGAIIEGEYRVERTVRRISP
jgi:hypothetical protein